MGPLEIMQMLSAGVSAASGLKNMLSGRSSGRSSGQQYGQVQPYGQQQGNAPQFGQSQITNMPGGSQLVKSSPYTQQQQDIFSQLGSQGMEGMGQLPSAEFDPIKKMYESHFQQQVAPGIAEMYSGAGAGGQRSSAFGQTLGAAGAGLSERLAGMHQQFNMQNRQSEIGRLMQMIQMGQQQQYQDYINPGEPGFFKSLMSQAGPALQGALQFGAPFLQDYLQGKYTKPTPKFDYKPRPMAQPGEIAPFATGVQ